MTNKIDPIKLKAAAEHLEWVCQQYPNEEKVQGLYKALQPVIEDAKAGAIQKPIEDRFKLPFRWAVSSEGMLSQFVDPDVEAAYVQFGVELEGGLTEQEKRSLEKMEAYRATLVKKAQSDA